MRGVSPLRRQSAQARSTSLRVEMTRLGLGWRVWGVLAAVDYAAFAEGEVDFAGEGPVVEGAVFGFRF